ncbi:unnamed protein product [Allacma fusca]|uniref:Uncharacterized protein n=1 Tax=Allacma fusca TaxID=39272 RepID=A0A8J2KHD4_9HEXA|nr:unnamed protein product [Allacma fusca]
MTYFFFAFFFAGPTIGFLWNFQDWMSSVFCVTYMYSASLHLKLGTETQDAIEPETRRRLEKLVIVIYDLNKSKRV